MSTCTLNKNWQEAKLKSIETVKRRNRENYYSNPSICKFCDVIIEYSKSAKRKLFCNSSCSASFNNKGKIKSEQTRKNISISLGGTGELLKSGNCLHCNNILNERHKIYCNNVCHRKYTYTTFIKEWKSGNISGSQFDEQILSKNIRKYIFEKYDNKCSLCGWAKINPTSGTLPLDIDHIDGDSSNHKEDNLILICPNCHSLTPTYKGANKGNGRHYRKIRYSDGKSY